MQALLYAAFSGLSALARALPAPVAYGGASAFAEAVYALYRLTPVRGFVPGNIATALPEADAHALARAHLRGLARGIVECFRMRALGPDTLAEWGRFEGLEHLEAARASGRGAVLAGAHFGNWELMGAAIARLGHPLHVVVQAPSQDAFARLFAETRARHGVRTWNNAGLASLRPVLKALRRGEVLGLLADQHGEARDVAVDFFGQRVYAPKGPLFFARTTGAALLPCFALREPDGSHRWVIEPELPLSGSDAADLQALYARLEARIRERPDHWLWVHNRWEHRAG